MKVLQKILFTFAMITGLSAAAFAQKDNPKPPPPKEKPPVVVPQPKNPPPKDNPKPKKPSAEMARWKQDTVETA